MANSDARRRFFGRRAAPLRAGEADQRHSPWRPHFSLIFYFARARKLTASKVHPPSRLLPVVFPPSPSSPPPPLLPHARPLRTVLPKKKKKKAKKKRQKEDARSTLGRGRVPEETNARRSKCAVGADYFYDVTWQGSSERDETAPLPTVSYNESSSPKERRSRSSPNAQRPVAP